VVYACSRPQKEVVYDLQPTKELFGYEPQDRWPEGAKDHIA
jgi:hypothetical protein